MEIMDSNLPNHHNARAMKVVWGLGHLNIVAVVKPGKMLYEITGVNETLRVTLYAMQAIKCL
jgi:ribosomal protein L16/L10AE